MTRRPPSSTPTDTLVPSTTLFRSKPGEVDRAGKLPLGPCRRFLEDVGHETAIDEQRAAVGKHQRRIDVEAGLALMGGEEVPFPVVVEADRKSTRLNSSH